MGTTETFLKSRADASAPVKTGQWHAGFSTVKKNSDKNNIPLLGVWSNGDLCSHCTKFEKCLMEDTFKKWAKTSGVDMWFGCSSDKSKDDRFEGTGFTWARNNKLKDFPFVRLYWKKGKVDVYKSGDDWIGGKSVSVSTGAKNLVKNLKAALKNYTPEPAPAPTPTPEPEPEPYKIRLNEAVTTKQVNAVLDAIDANGGYCPYQAKSADTKCHCKDFLQDKQIGEPCICNIYVKMEKK